MKNKKKKIIDKKAMIMSENPFKKKIKLIINNNKFHIIEIKIEIIKKGI